jgi:hypothetical protein
LLQRLNALSQTNDRINSNILAGMMHIDIEGLIDFAFSLDETLVVSNQKLIDPFISGSRGPLVPFFAFEGLLDSNYVDVSYLSWLEHIPYKIRPTNEFMKRMLKKVELKLRTLEKVPNAVVTLYGVDAMEFLSEAQRIEICNAYRNYSTSVKLLQPWIDLHFDKLQAQEEVQAGESRFSSTNPLSLDIFKPKTIYDPLTLSHHLGNTLCQTDLVVIFFEKYKESILKFKDDPEVAEELDIIRQMPYIWSWILRNYPDLK